MFKVRANVGIGHRRRGDVYHVSAAEYEKVKRFVTVLEAPEVEKPKPKVEVKVKRKPRAKKAEVKEEAKETADDGLLWSEPGEGFESVEADPVGEPDDEPGDSDSVKEESERD